MVSRRVAWRAATSASARIDPRGALVAALGDLTREQQPRHRGSQVDRPVRQLARAMFRRIVRTRGAEVARVRLEQRGVILLREPLEGLDGTLDPGRGRLDALTEGLYGTPLRSGVAGVRVHLEMVVRRAVRSRDAERKHRRVLVSAHLGGQAVPALAQRGGRSEPLRIEVANLSSRRISTPFQKHAHRAGGSGPYGHRARCALLDPLVAYERRGVHARLFLRTDEGPRNPPSAYGDAAGGSSRQRTGRWPLPS